MTSHIFALIFYKITCLYSKCTNSEIRIKGLGRHTREEVTRMGMADIQALVDYLGDKRVREFSLL